MACVGLGWLEVEVAARAGALRRVSKLTVAIRERYIRFLLLMIRIERFAGANMGRPSHRRSTSDLQICKKRSDEELDGIDRQEAYRKTVDRRGKHMRSGTDLSQRNEAHK